MPGAVFLRGDRVTLRTVEREDLDFVHAEKNKPAVHRSLVWPYPENRDALEEFLFEGDADADVKLLIAVDGEDDDPELVGSIGLDVDERPATGEVGLWIAPEYWGEGYGTEASRVLVDYAFDERNLHRVTAAAMETNEGSKRIWEKLGFEHEGVDRESEFMDGEYRDMHRYGVLESEWREHDVA
jgi:RimJ/RimL family protein N-acetyltransferase